MSWLGSNDLSILLYIETQNGPSNGSQSSAYSRLRHIKPLVAMGDPQMSVTCFFLGLVMKSELPQDPRRTGLGAFAMRLFVLFACSQKPDSPSSWSTGVDDRLEKLFQRFNWGRGLCLIDLELLPPLVSDPFRELMNGSERDLANNWRRSWTEDFFLCVLALSWTTEMWTDCSAYK